MVTMDEEKAEVQNSFFSSIFSNNQMGYLEDKQSAELAHRDREQARLLKSRRELLVTYGAT